MKIQVNSIEPWLLKNKNVKYNLAESGISSKPLNELLTLTNTTYEEILKCNLNNNDTRGSLQLRELIAELYDGVGPENVLVTTGVSEGLFIYFQQRFEKNSNIIVPIPSFPALYEVPKYLGYNVKFLHLNEKTNFRIDINELEGLIDSNTKIIVLNNPHNPTGMKLSEFDIKAIKFLANKHGIEIMADEHYRFIPHSHGELLPSIYSGGDNVVAVGSMAKCFGCVGLRVGWIVAPEELISTMRDLKDYITYTLCSINDFIAQRLLIHWKEISTKHNQWVLGNIEVFNDVIKQHSNKLHWYPPQAGVVGFPSLLQDKRRREDFSESLLNKTGVSVLPGIAFNSPKHFRIGFGEAPKTFRKAMEELSGFMDTY